MAGTLVISLAGLKLQNIEKLVSARGIDKVLLLQATVASLGQRHPH